MLKRVSLALIGLVVQTTTFAQVAGAPPSGRLLASNCFQCHGTNGKAVSGIERLAGKSASELKSELAEMKAQPEGKIMDVHAAAYTDEQIAAIAAYLATVK